MSGCGGGLIGAVSKGTEEEVADRRQESKEPAQGGEERLQSEENDKLLINSKQNGLTWVRGPGTSLGGGLSESLLHKNTSSCEPMYPEISL